MTNILLVLAFFTWSILAWKKPKFAVFAFPALLPLYLIRTKIGPLPTTLLEIIWLATLCGVTVKNGWATWRNGFAKTQPWRWALVLWTLAAAIAVGVAPDHIAALGLWRAYFLEPISFFILLNSLIENDHDRRSVLKAFALSAGVIVAISIIQFLTGQWIPSPWNTGILTRRATGPFPFPNAVSLFCAPLAVLFFGLVISEKSAFKLRTSSLWLWCGFLSAALATLLAKSVGGVLAILAAATTILLAKRRTRYWTLAAFALGISLIFAVPQFRGPTIQTLTFNGWSGRVRLWMYEETWNMLKDRPLWGAGLGAYPEVFKPYHKKTFIEIFQYPHNIVLNIWSETGLLGLLAFAWIVATWLRLGLRNSGGLSASSDEHPLISRLPYLLPLIAILVQGLVDVPYFKNDLAFAFWIFAALAASGLTAKPKAV